MLRLLYHLALFLFVLISLPKWLWESLRYRKHRLSFLQKLGFKLPSFSLPSTGPRIWIHSISVGETKAIAPLVLTLQEKIPHASIVISTVSETGQAEAKRMIPTADHYFFLPLDFSWVIRRLMKKIKPDLLILVEGDFWFNLITLAPHAALVNGKISQRALDRFRLIPFFSKPMFQKIDLLCVQSEQFADRFKLLGVDPSRLVVTGNLKFDQHFSSINRDHWRQDLGLKKSDRVVTIASTHEPEEELLLQALNPLMVKFPTLKILLVPRHPERFASVAALLEKKGIDFSRFSDHKQKVEHKRIVLIDAMGILSACYQLSELAIVGGSFTPRFGGHNIFEPAALGVPVLFGPYMQSQKDLADLITQAGAGKQVTLDNLAEIVDELLSNPSDSMRKAGLLLASEMHGSTTRTWHALEKLLGKG